MWSAQYTAFGRANITTPTATDDKPVIASSLRFPGQVEDAETGLYYNWHRYYDPELGRYVTADPIGLVGGVNLYAYVGGEPVNVSDPTGEIGLGGAIVGGIIDLGFQAWRYGANWDCYSGKQLLASMVMGAVGAGIGGKFAGTPGPGKIFSHWFPERAKNWPYFKKIFGNNFLRKGNINNGNYVTKERHYKHDNYYYGHEKGDGYLRRNFWGGRWPKPIQQLDRIPNTHKGAAAGGAAGSQIDCDCQ